MPFTILMLSFKGTEHCVKLTKENNMNKVFNMCFVPFIVLIYDILVSKSIPKKASVYAMNLIRPTIKRPKLMMVTAGIPAYHSQSSRAPHSIYSRCLTEPSPCSTTLTTKPV